MLEFIRKENKEHRTYFSLLYKWAVAFLTLIFAVIVGGATFFGMRTVSEARSAAKQAGVDATKEEVGRMRTEVSSRIDDEFKTGTIRQTVQEVAKVQSQTVLVPIINAEVDRQVRKEVEAQHGTIQSSILSETHKAVNELKPAVEKGMNIQISDRVEATVARRVQAEVEPAIDQLKRNLNFSTLITKAQSGDGVAYDGVVAVAHDQAASTEEQTVAQRIVSSIQSAHNLNGIYQLRSFTAPVTEDQMLQILQTPSTPDSRKAALDSLTDTAVRKNLDLIFKVMTTDNDLGVREAGFRRFDRSTDQKIEVFDNDSAQKWWSEHRRFFIK